jgi:pyruvate/2-oxoglutarate dehydrogenase complex dihydrolipoamide dehydrogenase (E3) component
VPDEVFDLVVIGGGAAGLAAARTGARLGRRTALVQDGRLGGDCTFTGCVPSKTLIEAASQGLSFGEAAARLHAVVEQVAATEDAGVLAKEGVLVVEGRATFAGPRQLSVGGRALRAARVVVATGSSPASPPVPGLAEVSYLTNESVFGLTALPRSLAILGGGAIGCELAQAFARFGSEVYLVEAEGRLLPREEPEASEVVGHALSADGVKILAGAKVAWVAQSAAGAQLELASGAGVLAEQLLVATGRRPVTGGLEPSAAGVELDERGFVLTDGSLLTTAAGVYAAGDVTGRALLTHAADEMGRLAVRNAFSRLYRRHFATSAIPQVTFTDPEVARVGLTEAEAADRKGARVAFLPMSALDRALAAQRTEGFVKLIAGPRAVLGQSGGGALLGASIVAPRAGEMVHEVALAMRARMFTGRLAQTVHAYPTWSTALRQAAAQFFFEVDGRRAQPARKGGMAG